MLKARRSQLLVLALVASFSALIASAQILNSERIEQTFGSFGIDVLYSDESLRVSNLYSEHGGQKITRTLAVVQYPAFVDPAFAAVHQQILDGGSIGATFQDAGWEVVKINLSVQAISQPDELTRSIGTDSATPIATHFYRLEIETAGKRFPYAEIVELHHPDYLTLEDLQRIYPLDADASRQDQPGDSSPSAEPRQRQRRLMSDGARVLAQRDSSLRQ